MSSEADVTARRSPETEQFQLSQLQNWTVGLPISTGKILIFAAVVIFGLFGIGGYWAATAEIGGAVTGGGRVVASGNNRIVQHLEGGILSEIHIREGEVVEAGGVVAELDVTQVRSQYAATQLQRATLMVELARWRAESEGADSFEVQAEDLEPVGDHPRVLGALRSQTAEFNASLAVVEKEQAILDAKIAAEHDEISSLEASIESYRTQGDLIKLEHADLSSLLDRGLTARPRVLALQRAISQVASQISAATYSIDQSRSNIRAFEDEKRKIDLEYTERANRNVSRVQKELNTTEDIEARLADRLRRSTLRSPVDGVVFRVHKTTPGAVLGAGEPFAEIFPISDELTIQAWVAPKDIAHVRLGQDVDVVFQSDHRANLTPMKGAVRYISTDTVVDEETGAASYVVDVSLDATNEPDRAVLPGNTADVYFRTEPKTLVDIVSEPITRFAFRSFKD